MDMASKRAEHLCAQGDQPSLAGLDVVTAWVFAVFGLALLLSV